MTVSQARRNEPLCQRLGHLEHRGGLAISGRELAVIRADEAHPAVTVVARALLGHGAFIDHGRTIYSGPLPVNRVESRDEVWLIPSFEAEAPGWQPHDRRRVWREGDVAWAQVLGVVVTRRDGIKAIVPCWTTGVFAREESGWRWRYWGGAEPQAEPRV